MFMNPETIDALLDAATAAAAGDPEGLPRALDELPAAIYVTDKAGTITYFNPACAQMAGREPIVGSDKWCVTWKLFASDGEPLPHDQCPMAVALREKREVRGVDAIAERPDGTRIAFTPFPTPLFDSDGDLVGAVNLLVETSNKAKASYFETQASRCRRLAAGSTDLSVVETLTLMAANYDEHYLRLVKQV
jgi:PAS domain S-box-containing protein